ncbi:unnamed protein product [Rangifer tarandus platyrhynchus]|uniref:Uncharacterized protein n=2 Tax=Rangifer tarandus platyrhynchus TaxID=3082113 RepID=A0ABN8YLS0_RANTA|nr:unnamed protein product [Rangifer tarandus platyrhynchus]
MILLNPALPLPSPYPLPRLWVLKGDFNQCPPPNPRGAGRPALSHCHLQKSEKPTSTSRSWSPFRCLQRGAVLPLGAGFSHMPQKTWNPGCQQSQVLIFFFFSFILLSESSCYTVHNIV